MARVLILDGHCSAALAFVRSLGRAGHFVVVGSEARFFAPATYSRYCHKSCHYPSPVEGVNEFLSVIEGIVDREKIEAIFPMTDITVWPLSYWRERFVSVKIAIPPHAAIELVSDKFQTVKLAESLGVPVPETMLVTSQEDVARVLTREWRYPIVVKDRFSMRWEQGRGVPGGVEFAYGAEELTDKVSAKLTKTGDVVVQHFTGGVGIGFSCFAVDGEVLWPFQWQRIREKDPRGSGSSARKSRPLERDVYEYSVKLVAASGFQGICMVEFKKNPLTGELSLMEINGRPWGSLQLPIHAGFDYPRAEADWLLQGKLPERGLDYTKNITCRWLVADLIHLENVKEGPPPGWPMPYPSFSKACFDVLQPWYPGLRNDHFSWSDPSPGVVELLRWLRDHLHR